MGKHRRRRRIERQQGADLRPAADDLNAGSRAQLVRDEDKREYRPRQDDASVEDPLGDWPQDADP